MFLFGDNENMEKMNIWIHEYKIMGTQNLVIHTLSVICSTFSEKGDKRMSGSQFLYVMICSSLCSIIALHLCVMFFHIFLFVQL